MKKAVLWGVCIFSAVMLVFSIPARELISPAAGDITRIAGFAAMFAFIILRSVWKHNSQDD